MPATPLGLTFQRFTDLRIAFANVEAINAFFDDITVSISSENIPNAGASTLGGVLLAATVAYAPAVLAGDYNGLDIEGVVTLIPSRTYVDAIATKLDALVAAYVADRAARVAAGQLSIL